MSTNGDGGGDDAARGAHEVPFWHHDLEPAAPAAPAPAPTPPAGPATWAPVAAERPVATPSPPAPLPPLDHAWDQPATDLLPPLDHAWDQPAAAPPLPPLDHAWGQPEAAVPPPPAGPNAWGAPAAAPPPPPQQPWGVAPGAPPPPPAAQGGWMMPPPVPPPAPERSRVGAPVIAAVIAVVALMGAMVFLVATHDSSKPPSTASSDLATGAGSSDTSASSSQATAKIDAKALQAQLKSFTPDTVDLSTVAGIGRDGASWKLFDEQALTSAQTVSTCAPDAPAAAGAFGRQWALADPNGGLHGQAVIKVQKYDSPATASSAVKARTTKAFESCYLQDLEQTLKTEAMTDDVDPPVVTSGTDQPSPTGALLRISTSEAYRTAGGACTQYEDTSWRQVGSWMIYTSFSTCQAPFDKLAEIQLEESIKAQMKG